MEKLHLMVDGEVVYYVRTDHIGRPVFATDGTGAKVWEATYLPFGEVLATAGNPIALRFPGQWFQAESGLHQNWMRDYDPTTGRYMQADPLGLVDGASVYGYAGQNPMRYIDPRGEHKGDRWYGRDNREFPIWFHQCWKQPGNPDADQEEIEEAYQEWIDRGSPTGGRCDATPRQSCQTCAEVVVAGATGYILYRCFRMVPSLFPAFWGTIPYNLATP